MNIGEYMKTDAVSLVISMPQLQGAVLVIQSPPAYWPSLV